MKPATRWFDESFAPMPCCDERFARQQQAPASITVSHDFAVAGYSSPPFGSNYQYLDSKPYPVDIGLASAADLETSLSRRLRQDISVSLPSLSMN